MPGCFPVSFGQQPQNSGEMDAEETEPPGVANYQHSPGIFTRVIVSFVKALSKDDRAAFRFWCVSRKLIPRKKLEGDVDVADDSEIFKVVGYLQDGNKLSFTDVSLLKSFLSDIGRIDLLKELNLAELRIAVDVIAGNLCKVNSSARSVSSGCKLMYANIVQLLMVIREKNKELISEALDELKQANDEIPVLVLLHDVIRKNAQLSSRRWPRLITLLVLIGELYSSLSLDYDKDITAKINESFAEWMLELGGLVSKYII